MICNKCGNEIDTKWNNKRMCPSCVGKRSYAGYQRPLLPKMAKRRRDGYLYYTANMCTDDELELLPGHSRTVLAHRLIMAKHIGHPLQCHELVRHINGDKADNRIDNLVIGNHADNSMDNRTAILELEKWQRLAAWLFILTSRQPMIVDRMD